MAVLGVIALALYWYSQSWLLMSVYPDAPTVRLSVVASGVNKTVTLNDEQADRLRGSLYSGPPPIIVHSCYVPHHFFRFYDKAGKEVGEVEVCFCCGGGREAPSLMTPGRRLDIDEDEVKAIVRELGLPVDVGC